MCKCTPEIRTPFCGRDDCLPPGFANLSEWLGEQGAAAQMSLDRVWEQAVQQAMEGRKTDPGMETQGFHPCSKCDGRGFIRTLVDGIRDSEPCSYCRMSGRVMEEQR